MNDAEDQLTIHRGLHSLAGPLLAMLRERLMREKLSRELLKMRPSLEISQALEAINRYCELAEEIQLEIKPW